MTEDLKAIQARLVALFSSKKTKTLEHPPITNPVRDWKLLLCGVSLGIVGCAIGAGFVYLDVEGVRSSATLAPESTAAIERFSPGALTELLEQHKGRVERHNSITGKPSSVVDPGQ